MPAVTIVAAWIRAETGVGPSIASGSQTCSGNWALLPHRAGEEQERDPGQRLARLADAAGRLREDRRRNCSVPNGPEDQHDAQAEAEVADAVDDECLLGGVGRRAALEVVADQQVGAETDRLPEDEEEQEVVGQHQHQHREDEERQVGEEAVVAAGSPCM